MRRRTRDRIVEKVGIALFIALAALAIGYVALLIYDAFTDYQLPK